MLEALQFDLPGQLAEMPGVTGYGRFLPRHGMAWTKKPGPFKGSGGFLTESDQQLKSCIGEKEAEEAPCIRACRIKNLYTNLCSDETMVC